MKLNILTPEGKVVAHLRHVRHVMVNIFDPAKPGITILDKKMEKILKLEYTSEEVAQDALTACVKTIKKYEATVMLIGGDDPIRVPCMDTFQFPYLYLEADQ